MKKALFLVSLVALLACERNENQQQVAQTTKEIFYFYQFFEIV